MWAYDKSTILYSSLVHCMVKHQNVALLLMVLQ